MNIIKRIIQFFKDARTARATLKEWLGEGGRPVSRSQAQGRADMCLACVHNRLNDFWTPSEALHRAIESKAKIRLRVLGESGLNNCQLCRCHLPLKVHVPIKHIRQYMREETRQAIISGRPDCWQLLDR